MREETRALLKGRKVEERERRLRPTFCLTAGTLVGILMLPAPPHAGSDQHQVFTPEAVEWQEGPESLPPGAHVSLLEGHPTEKGPLTLRLRFPAGYEIPPHTHPQIEHVTVLSGTFHIGNGTEFDKSASTEVSAGGYVVIPIEHAHYAWVSEDTEVQLHSNGPWGISYVSSDDDPRQGD